VYTNLVMGWVWYEVYSCFGLEIFVIRLSLERVMEV